VLRAETFSAREFLVKAKIFLQSRSSFHHRFCSAAHFPWLRVTVSILVQPEQRLRCRPDSGVSLPQAQECWAPFSSACPFVLVWIHLVPAQSKRAGQFFYCHPYQISDQIYGAAVLGASSQERSITPRVSLGPGSPFSWLVPGLFCPARFLFSHRTEGSPARRFCFLAVQHHRAGSVRVRPCCAYLAPW
jgi:hypothetical protein